MAIVAKILLMVSTLDIKEKAHVNHGIFSLLYIVMSMDGNSSLGVNTVSESDMQIGGIGS